MNSGNRDIYPNRANRPAPNGSGGNGGKTLWIVIGIIIVIAAIGIVYAATQRTIKTNDADQNIPVTQDSGTDVMANQVAVPVTYTGFDVVNLQSFPYRVQVRVRGTVPEGCAVAQVPTATVSGKAFTVAMTASKDEDAMCTQVVTNVENTVELPVAGLAAGTYTVKVGTMAAKSFTLSANNSIEYSGDK